MIPRDASILLKDYPIIPFFIISQINFSASRLTEYKP